VWPADTPLLVKPSRLGRLGTLPALPRRRPAERLMSTSAIDLLTAMFAHRPATCSLPTAMFAHRPAPEQDTAFERINQVRLRRLANDESHIARMIRSPLRVRSITSRSRPRAPG